MSQLCSGDADEENVHDEAILPIRATKTEETDHSPLVQ